MDLQSLIIACRGIDIVFHTAGIVDITCSLKSRKRMRQVNIDGVRNIIEAVRVCKVSRLVYYQQRTCVERDSTGESPLKRAGTLILIRSEDRMQKQRPQVPVSCLKLLIRASMPSSSILRVLSVLMITGWVIWLRWLQLFSEAHSTSTPPVDIIFVDVRDVADGIIKAGAYGKRGECYILSGEYHTVRELFSYPQRTQRFTKTTHLHPPLGRSCLQPLHHAPLPCVEPSPPVHSLCTEHTGKQQ